MATKYNPRIVTDGLVLCLDAGNTKSYPGSGTTWTDMVGANNGTLSNGPTFSSDNGGSMVFDGTNDHVDFASSNDFKFGTGDFTISYWLEFDVLGSLDSPLDMRGSSWTNTGYSDFIDSNKWQTWYKSPSYPSAADNWYTSSATLVTDKWYNFVVSRDSGTVKFYINNVLDGSVTFNNDMVGDGLVIGWNVSSQSGRAFDGKFSSMLVYKGKALSATEVAQNYNSLKGRFGL
mgnify:CR=1 FL=1|tara:strand:- start:1283 stop:1978 length:696 start_codon:yes stop_codon:yes gene_type:complete